MRNRNSAPAFGFAVTSREAYAVAGSIAKGCDAHRRELNYAVRSFRKEYGLSGKVVSKVPSAITADLWGKEQEVR
jgi:hypothetical protein